MKKLTYSARSFDSVPRIHRAGNPTKPSNINSKSGKSNSYSNIKRGVLYGFILCTIGTLVLFFINDPAYALGTMQAFTPGSPLKIKYDTYTLSFSDEIDQDLREEIEEELSVMVYEGKKRFEIVEDEADLQIRFTTEDIDEKDALYFSYLVPVGHLYWVRDDVEKSSLATTTIISDTDSDEIAAKALSQFAGSAVEVNDSAAVRDDLKVSEDKIAFIDISRLEPQLKLLSLDGKYFLEDEQGGIKYAFAIKSDDVPDFIKEVLRNRVVGLIAENADSFQEESVMKLNMTGVTAISRSLATKTNASGNPGYAAEKISDFLKDADLTHTSNEVSFVEGCTPSGGLRFCSAPEYIKALEDSGMDIIELTGNHNNDFGASSNADSIQIYKDKGWDYFGGGLNKEDAAKILYKDIKGTKLAFIGYNYYDTMLGTGALAGESRAGANSYSTAKLEADIAEAKKNAHVVIVDFQFQECYSYPATDVIFPICYKPLSNPDQEAVFREAIDLGADIVVGTQAHQPQTFEIYKDKLIFYGLGNLFFDQTPWIGTRQGLILSHYFYNGRLIQTRINTTIYDSDMRTYVTNGDKRELLLELLKEARD